MHISRITILFIYNIMLSICSFAQQPFSYFFHHIDQTDGLLHNEVFSTTQDAKGFMWITTPNGLQRYDGLNFKYYPYAIKNINDGTTYRAELFADKKNNLLWLGTNYTIEKMPFQKDVSVFYNGLNLLDDASQKFETFSDGKNGNWLVSNNALYYYDSVYKKNNLYHVNIIAPNYPYTTFMAVDTVSKETWVTLWSEIYLFDRTLLKVYSHINNPKKHPLLQLLHGKKKTGALRFIIKDSRKNIWVTTWGDTLYKYDNDLNKVKTYLLSAINNNAKTSNTSPQPPALINCMLEDDHQTIWVGTENAGLLRYNYEKDNFDYCVVQENNKESIAYSYKIFSLFQDKEKNVWVGTDRGISIFNPYQQFFKTLKHQENNPLSITKNELVSFIQTTNGDIFIGTWGGGIGSYNSNFNFKKNLFFNPPEENNFVWSFTQPNDETLWVGCQLGYLQLYNLKTGSIKTLHPTAIEGSTIRCMEKDSAGNIWCGLQNGALVKWHKKTNEFVKCGDNNNINIKRAPVTKIFIDKQQQCWVSTENGFRSFDLIKNSFTNTWLPIKNNIGAISSTKCEGIEQLNDSILAVATIFGGINFFNKHTKKFSQLRMADGLPADNIHALKKDDKGFLWFTTDYNLYKINIQSKKIIPNNIPEGIINSSFVSTSFYQLQNGNWVTFTLAETLIFSPIIQKDKESNSLKTEITEFKVFNKKIIIDSLLSENKPVKLSYKQNFFTIEFAVLNFSSLIQTNYYHKLIGVDKDWVNDGTNRFANYTDVQPGSYIFEIKADDGKNDGGITSFKLIITPPFWKTWWFISISIFLLLVLFYNFIKWRVKSVKTIASAKIKVQKLQAERYKDQLELEQIINYFTNSLIDKNTVEHVLNDVTNNLIERIGFVNCIIYLWNSEKTDMVKKAATGSQNTVAEKTYEPFDVTAANGIINYVLQHKVAVVIRDTTKDIRYKAHGMACLSEITVPIIYNNELLGIIDSRHPEKDFYTVQHMQVLTTIATLVANKIKSIEAEDSLQKTQFTMYSINDQLSKAKLDALRSQMNPHFIFNCINSIDALIQSNDKYLATVYLNKFAKLLRNILDSSNQNTVTLSKDLETLKLYIALQQLRYENKFTAEIRADEFLLQSDFKVPPLIVQPFVENAILHGIRYRADSHGRLYVHVTKKGNRLQYIIEDNGVGRGFHEKQIPKEKISYGLAMTIDRVKLFNNEDQASLEIIDLVKNHKPCGTRVTLLLKIK